mmetsp:Transcript_71576/g.155532  ORF Transcript_71576/g.155532 Transcript_71576/m.155532 type:complete len:364 (-) Transcript_71576:174-1265(-)
MALAVESYFEKQEASARWRLGDLSLLSTEVNKTVSPGEMLEILGIKFSLNFCWGGWSKETSSLFTSVYAKTLGEVPPSLCYSFGISLISQQSCPNYTKGLSKTVTTSSGTGTWGWQSFKLRSEILGSHYVLNDSLILELSVVAWPEEQQVKRLCTAAATLSPIPEASGIRAELRELLRSGEGSDITLIVHCSTDEASSDHQFQAHRFVLSMRSPVFKKMLSSGMQESGPEATVKLSDIEPRVLGWLLVFIYTEELDDEACQDDEALCHLLAAAHFYEVKALVRLCEEKVAMQLSEEAAAERLMMADRLGLDGLHSDIIDFMCYSDDRLSKIQASEGFDRLKDKQPLVAYDILSKRLSKRMKRS